MYKRGKDFMKKFESLRKDNIMEIINFETKDEFINKKNSSNGIKMQTFILFYKEKRKDKYAEDKNCIKVKLGVIVVIEGNIEVLHISYVI